MNKCIVCKKEIENYLCHNCINQDLEELCQKIINDYKLNPEQEEFYNNPKTPNLLENIILDITKNIPSPKKEYYIIKTMYYKYYSVSKTNREYLINNYKLILDDELFNKEEKNIILALLLDTYYKNYDYYNAEKIATILSNEKITDEKILYNLGDYYIITRRYDLALNYLNKAIKYCLDEQFNKTINNKIEECKLRNLGKEQGGKNPYLPSIIEYKEIYQDFLESIGIFLELPISRAKAPQKIKEEDYPKPIELKESGFTSFVAFDIETTGINHQMDSITEIAAIKVIDGKIVETKEFIFQELVHPYKRKIPKEVEKITGITNDMVFNSREVWKVFEDFTKFIGDNILVGYNCMTFDSKFLVRAGRLSNIKIYNKYFDVMKYAQTLKNKLNYKNKTLVNIGNILGIENPNAHRALSDAITTAKVYLKLLELDK